MRSNRPTVLARWAIHSTQVGQILYVDGKADPAHTLPYVGDVITRPFLLDPVTREPIPVRVTRVQVMPGADPAYIIVEVARADRPQ